MRPIGTDQLDVPNKLKQSYELPISMAEARIVVQHSELFLNELNEVRSKQLIIDVSDRSIGESHTYMLYREVKLKAPTLRKVV